MGTLDDLALLEFGLVTWLHRWTESFKVQI
jgi:hypothetical protein